MNKNAAVRVTETLNFLNNVNCVTLGITTAQRTNAHTFAQNYITNTYPVTTSNAYKNFSSKMSLGIHWFNPDPNNRRKMCRCIFLLCSAINAANMNFTMPYQNASQVSQATAERELANYIRKASIMQEAPATTTLQQILGTAFPNNPLQFLQENKIMVFGSRVGPPLGTDINLRNFYFSYNPSRDRYEFQTTAPGHQIQANSVVAVHWANVPGRVTAFTNRAAELNAGTFTGIQGIQLDGVNVMVTTQFSGCSFCMKEEAGTMYCGHISPKVSPGDSGGMDGTLLARQLCGVEPYVVGGDFANTGGLGVFHVYGINYGNGAFPGGYDFGASPPGGGQTYMSIVGFPGGTSYRIFSQITTNSQVTIGNVNQIF